MSRLLRVAMPRGEARARVETPPGARGLLTLGHGAGGGVSAADLQAVRRALVSAGVAVALVEQPYRVAGRRAPAPARRLDEAWRAAVAALKGDAALAGLPLIVGGRSSGGRVACRTANDTGAVGVVAMAFPLHPPGRPERSRAAELTLPTGPVLVVNGDSDPFGIPEPDGHVEVRVMPGETHALNRDPEAVASAVRVWVDRVLGGMLRPRGSAAEYRLDDGAR